MAHGRFIFEADSADFLVFGWSGTGPAALGGSCFRTSHRLRSAMNMHVNNRILANFPTILFRKKRLTVAIHAQFDLECAEDVEALRTRIEQTMTRLEDGGDAKIVYTLTDL
jgi:hypothetical protein